MQNEKQKVLGGCILELAKKIDFGEVTLKIENGNIVDIIETHKHKPNDLINKNAEKVLTELAKNDRMSM